MMLSSAEVGNRCAANNLRESVPMRNIGQSPCRRRLMRRAIFLACLASVSISAVGQERLQVLTQVAQIRKLSAPESQRKYPITLRGVVTYNSSGFGVTFVQDSTAGIFVLTRNSPSDVKAGDFVEVHGVTGPGDFAPVVDQPQIRVLGQAPFPSPRQVTFDDLLTGKEDSQWIEIQGIVHSVGTERRLPPTMTEGPAFLDLGIAASTNRFKVRVGDFDPGRNYDYLVDSSVSIRGVCGTLFNERRQLIGIQIFAPGMDQIRVTETARLNPYELPVLPTNGLMQFSPEKTSGHRIRVQGNVTYYRPGRFLFIQDSSGGVNVQSTRNTPLQPGDLVDVTGFPSAGPYAPILEDAEFRKIGTGVLPRPVDLTGAADLNRDYDAQLVTIRGKLIDQTFRGTNAVLTLQQGSLIFTAHLEQAASDSHLASLRDGSMLQATGVWSVETDKYRRPTAYRLLLRSSNDIALLERPPWLTGTRILAVLGILAGIILLGALWVIILRRRVDERTETIRASLESTADGILVIDSSGRVSTSNRKFAEMWHIPESVLTMRDDRTLLDFVVGQLKDPDAFLKKVRELYADKDAQSDDLIEFKDGRIFERHSEPQRIDNRNVGRVWGFRDITQSKRAQEERENLISELQQALSKVKLLSGLLPICASCKKIRDDRGYWNQIEGYIRQHSEAEFSHSICPQCLEKLYPEFSSEELPSPDNPEPKFRPQ